MKKTLQLFSRHRGTHLLPVEINNGQENGTGGLYISGLRDGRTGEVILKMVNTSAAPVAARLRLDGVARINGTGRAVTLASADLKAENSLDEPRRVAPVEQSFKISAPEFSYNLPGQSVVVLQIPTAAK
ncbi:MAG: alpha-L-arabinofuranosidase C-terminal domain-containing protein [Blastocatellia bacterium]